MSLKSLIQRLLDSRTTPAQAAHSAMPDNGTDIAPGDLAYTDIVATSDGYVFQVVGGKLGESTYSIVNNTNLGIANQCNSMNGNSSRTFVPCRKGDKITCSRQSTPKTDVIIRFYKTVGSVIGATGGGYNSFIRRALSCLRPSFNYSPKVFSRAKNSGLAVKHSLKQLLHWMFRHVPSLHRLMGILDTSTLSAVEANSCSIWIRVKKHLAVKSLVIAGFLQQIPTARQQYLSRKAVLLLLLPTRCSIKFGLLRLQALRNLQAGGALC